MICPLRDVITPRTTPVMTWALLLVMTALHAWWWFSTTGPVGPLLFTQMAGNTVALLVFGENVEDQTGHARFVVFVLLCGITAAAFHPAAGITAAVAGVMGGYFVMFFHSRLLLRLPFTVIEVPALFFPACWLLLETGGTRFAAPLSGLVAGAALIRLFRRPERAGWEWRER
jgi:membrane associated rhomboid family serine protease